MIDSEFWAIVEAARSEVPDPVHDADAVAAALVKRLSRLPLPQIVDYAAAYERVQQSAYRWDLWAAAYLIGGGCSDDGFDYFRGWLVAQGRTVFEAALANPDSLADIVDADVDADSEDFLGAGPEAYEQAGGDGEAFWDALPAPPEGSGQPAGDNLDPEDVAAVAEVLPRLSAMYAEG